MTTQPVDLLQRDVIPDFPSDLLGEPDLLKEAKTKFGYEPDHTDAQMRAVLNGLGIAPFTAKSVEAYKAAVSQREPRPRWWSRWLLAPVLAGSVIGGYGWWSSHASWCVVAAGALTVIAGFIAGGVRVLNASDHRKRWMTTHMRHYTAPIPNDVLRMAVQISETCPEAQFWISWFGAPDARRAADPFLIVTLPSADVPMYHIAVWDEPGFSSTTIA